MVLTYGRVALYNVAFVIFLSLKNTPLAILSDSSYETLMPLHKAAGYTCIVASLVHAIIYLITWAQIGILNGLLEPSRIAGIMGGIALLVIGVSNVPYIRRQHYECMLRHSTSAELCLTNLLHSILRCTCCTVGLHFNSHRIASARI